eukprot:11368110-Alexandrium_andersonii.AAC.1
MEAAQRRSGSAGLRDQADRMGVFFLARLDFEDRGGWCHDLTQDGDVEPEPGPVEGGGPLQQPSPG